MLNTDNKILIAKKNYIFNFFAISRSEFFLVMKSGFIFFNEFEP